jgi:hypothetical protein
MGSNGLTIRLEPWTQADLSLLQQANTPEMTAHLDHHALQRLAA